MKIYGQSSISEFLGDNVVYRNLEPVNRAIPSFSALCGQLGLASRVVPRKTTPEYARVLVEMLNQARRMNTPAIRLKRVIYIGDTRLNDGEAFLNICRAGGWPGMGFIGADRNNPPQVDIEQHAQAALYLANRWQALTRFVNDLKTGGFPVDESTALLLDIDKTILGARGRNDRLIDRARIEAAQKLAAEILGSQFDTDAFQQTYDWLNQPEYHAFTTDNQDYLVYTCLIVNSHLLSLDDLLETIQIGKAGRFADLIAYVDGCASQLPPALKEVHTRFAERYQSGDPTPFKQFRQYEYLNTERLLRASATSDDVDHLLKETIVMTNEVYELAAAWKNQGVLLFGLSDKPDEASLPGEELKSKGHLPIHQIQTQIVGDTCAE